MQEDRPAPGRGRSGARRDGRGSRRGPGGAGISRPGKGRVGLVSMASTFPEFRRGTGAPGGAPGRPGLNALKTKARDDRPRGDDARSGAAGRDSGAGERTARPPKRFPRKRPTRRAAAVRPDQAPPSSTCSRALPVSASGPPTTTRSIRRPSGNTCRAFVSENSTRTCLISRPSTPRRGARLRPAGGLSCAT